MPCKRFVAEYEASANQRDLDLDQVRHESQPYTSADPTFHGSYAFFEPKTVQNDVHHSVDLLSQGPT